jgi:hypothetical protein
MFDAAYTQIKHAVPPGIVGVALCVVVPCPPELFSALALFHPSLPVMPCAARIAVNIRAVVSGGFFVVMALASL